jgi:hypothetical protein
VYENITRNFFAVYEGHILVRIVTSRRLRCAGHLVRIGDTRNAYRIFMRISSENIHHLDER